VGVSRRGSGHSVKKNASEHLCSIFGGYVCLDTPALTLHMASQRLCISVHIPQWVTRVGSGVQTSGSVYTTFEPLNLGLSAEPIT